MIVKKIVINNKPKSKSQIQIIPNLKMLNILIHTHLNIVNSNIHHKDSIRYHISLLCRHRIQMGL